MDNPFGPPAEPVVAKKVEENNVAKVAEKQVEEEEKNDQDEQVEPDPSEEQEKAEDSTPEELDPTPEELKEDHITPLIHACHHLQYIDEVAQSHTEIEEAKFEIIRLARELPRD